MCSECIVDESPKYGVFKRSDWGADLVLKTDDYEKARFLMKELNSNNKDPVNHYFVDLLKFHE